MNQVCIPIPQPAGHETIELEVTIGGTKHWMQYRVEQLDWTPGASADERVEQLRAFIHNYDPDWELVQVGAPGLDAVPVTFRQRRPREASTTVAEPSRPRGA